MTYMSVSVALSSCDMLN